MVQRVLAAGAAAAAIGGAVMMRAWDRKAGRKVAELTRARVRDEWRTEERIAELETDVEESREIRFALETKLRAKRAELARLRSEHAELLRRYATAETERASALEGRRLLAIEASAPAKALPVPSGLRKPQSAAATAPSRASAPSPSPSSSPAGASAESSARGSVASPARESATSPARAHTRAAVPAPALYARADQALRRLARSAACQRDAAQGAESRREAAQDGEGRDKHRAAATPALRPVPAAAAAVPPPRPTVSRAQGGFDFFGNAAPAQPRQLTAPLEEDLADVVGDEAVAEQSARARAAGAASGAESLGDGERAADAGREGDRTAPGSAAPDGATTGGVGEVIDLTAHDETEQLDMAELRTALS
ncbi:hypothetical protein SNA_00740 [Streptomyces natalensis ATCC 27448]|uniref:Secreted protein n=1 Tax=Streptomyces natalensis ATCC 27448 TaxID=1240678 RepID=A0A0D7CWK8_9ACTN|nr:hypothetical protein SNA_00740 [Streptomyces natalensis ATCC 27448]